MSETIQADYCVVGLGPAGAVLASKLAASGKKVVILEQGPRITEDDRAELFIRSQENLNDFASYNDNVREGVITPLSSARTAGQVVEWSAQRLFAVGGTALHFEGFMVRPMAEDLSVKTLYGYGRDWPLTYNELEPWLLRAEHEIGVAGNEDNPYTPPRSGRFPMPAHAFSYFDREIFGPALKRLGFAGHSCPRAVNSVAYRGRSACLVCRACKFCPTGARYSPDRVHVPIIDQYPNATILEEVSLRRLEVSANSEKIVAAHAMRVQEQSPLVVKARDFILALGGVETPRMLLLSADKGQHKDGLGNIGGQLGQGFNDHPIPWVVYDVGRPVGSRLGFETMSCDYFRAHQQRGNQPSLLMVGSPAVDYAPVGYAAAAWATEEGVLSLERLRDSIPRIAAIYAYTETEGKGKLELDHRKLDAFGSPVAKVTMKLTDWDRKGPAKLAELAPEIGEAMGATNYLVGDTWQSEMGYHPSGATAMAERPADGVCDPNLKVFGLDNLYLVSNSVFPHMGASMPTLTIVALALRLAAHLEGKLSA
ncbi:MAG: GMC family oxidoreductase [Candidatus Binatia bacterium]